MIWAWLGFVQQISKPQIFEGLCSTVRPNFVSESLGTALEGVLGSAEGWRDQRLWSTKSKGDQGASAACNSNDLKLNFGGRKIWDTGRSSFHSPWTPTGSISPAPTSLTAWETWNVYGTKQKHHWASLSLKRLEHAFVKLFPETWFAARLAMMERHGEFWRFSGIDWLSIVYFVRVMEFLKAARMCLPAWADPNMCCSKWRWSCNARDKHV